MGKKNWNPWLGLEMAAEELNQIMGESCHCSGNGAPAVWQPAVDMREDKNGVVIQLDLPGIPLGDIAVEVKGSELLVYGMRRVGEDTCSSDFHILERPCGPFARRLQLPRSVDQDSVCARLNDGVLTITVSRKENTQRTIVVE